MLQGETVQTGQLSGREGPFPRGMDPSARGMLARIIPTAYRIR